MGIKQLRKESRPQVDESMMLFIVLFIERQLVGSQEAIKSIESIRVEKLS